MADWENKLFFGDNLDILQKEIDDESIDLIYLDSPFNSKATYNVLFQEHSGSDSESQIAVFEDTWHWTEQSETVFHDLLTAKETPESVINLMQAFRSFLGTSDMMAYIAMMAPRLRELHRALKQTGSLYLHCDTTASHYLKLLLDAIFDPRNFLNEVIWKRSSAHSDSSAMGRAHDCILLYAKDGDSFVWNPQYQAYDEEYIQSHYSKIDAKGRRFGDFDLSAKGLQGGVDSLISNWLHELRIRNHISL